MSHLPDRNLREQIYRASLTRASEIGYGDWNNIPLIYEILKIKQEISKLLGFNNYAEQSLARKMAPPVESVRELSDLIAEKALPAAEMEKWRIS
jgi:oligopeptidase A